MTEKEWKINGSGYRSLYIFICLIYVSIVVFKICKIVFFLFGVVVVFVNIFMEGRFRMMRFCNLIEKYFYYRILWVMIFEIILRFDGFSKLFIKVYYNFYVLRLFLNLIMKF